MTVLILHISTRPEHFIRDYKYRVTHIGTGFKTRFKCCTVVSEILSVTGSPLSIYKWLEIFIKILGLHIFSLFNCIPSPLPYEKKLFWNLKFCTKLIFCKGKEKRINCKLSVHKKIQPDQSSRLAGYEGPALPEEFF